MKSNKMISLDLDLINYLSNHNASGLITRLLRENIDKENLTNLTEAQLHAELKVNKLTRKKDKEIKEIRQNA